MPSPDTDYRPLHDVLADVRSDADGRIEARTRRRRHLARAAGATVVVLGLVGVAAAVGLGGSGDDDGRTTVAPTTSTTVPGPTPGTSLPMAEAPIAPRWAPITAWTGTELLVWGGSDSMAPCEDAQGCAAPVLVDGARYDPSTDTWRPMAPAPIEADRNGLWGVIDGVWTGRELIVVGGREPTVAAYDPRTDSWRTIDPGRAEVTYGMRVHWTGAEVVLLGGLVENDDPDAPPSLTAAASLVLDPVTDTWRTLPEPPLKDLVVEDLGTLKTPMELSNAKAAPLGSALLVSEGSGDGENPAHVAVLDATSGSWRSAAPLPSGVVEALVPADGRVIAVLRSLPGGDEETEDPAGGPPDETSVAQNAVSVYDPAEDAWSTPVPLTTPRYVDEAIWANDRLLVTFGDSLVSEEAEAFAAVSYDPSTGTVAEVEVSELARRDAPALVWTGDQFLVWGGSHASSDGSTPEPMAGGSRFRPA